MIQFSKPLSEFQRTSMRERFEDRLPRKSGPEKQLKAVPIQYDKGSGKSTWPKSTETTLKIPEMPEEMDPKERTEAINNILFERRYEPTEVLKNSQDIKKLLFVPKVSAVNAGTLEAQAKRDLTKAAKDYEKYLKIIKSFLDKQGMGAVVMQ